jgi:hypothetical protein
LVMGPRHVKYPTKMVKQSWSRGPISAKTCIHSEQYGRALHDHESSFTNTSNSSPQSQLMYLLYFEPAGPDGLLHIQLIYHIGDFRHMQFSHTDGALPPTRSPFRTSKTTLPLHGRRRLLESRGLLCPGYERWSEPRLDRHVLH